MSQESQGLKREMNSRQLAMIGIGAIIGTGLFLNSGYTIKNAGPGGTLICYLFGAVVMYLVMVCLAELSVVFPKAGSFQEYSARLISPGFGSAIGWLYWYCWVLTIAWYLSAVGLYMQYWLPKTPVTMWCLIFGLVLFIFNSVSVKNFGEGQFWFAGIKVFAIIIFIAICLGRLLGIGGPSPGLANLYMHKGFFPIGLISILPVLMSVVFAYQGGEVLGNAAEEAKDPAVEMPKAIRSSVFQMVGLYVLSVLFIMITVPWTSISADQSPFVTVLSKLGIPGADHIMNLVVILAALSAANSAIYSCTRFLFSLGEQGAAPKAVTRLNKNHIPFNALIVTTIGIIICLITNLIPALANTVNVWMWAVSGLIGAVAWIVIGVCVVCLRRNLAREGKSADTLPYRSPCYPLVPALAIILNTVVLVGMLLSPDQRLSLYIGLPIVILTFAFFIIRDKYLNTNTRGKMVA